jgi:hypothetical protein
MFTVLDSMPFVVFNSVRPLYQKRVKTDVAPALRATVAS